MEVLAEIVAGVTTEVEQLDKYLNLLRDCLASDECRGVFDRPGKACYGLRDLGKEAPVATTSHGLSYAKTYAPLYETVFTGAGAAAAGPARRFSTAFNSGAARLFSERLGKGEEEACLGACAAAEACPRLPAHPAVRCRVGVPPGDAC